MAERGVLPLERRRRVSPGTDQTGALCQLYPCISRHRVPGKPAQPNPYGSKVPKHGVYTVFVLGIITMILGMYTAFGYLDPQGTSTLLGGASRQSLLTTGRHSEDSASFQLSSFPDGSPFGLVVGPQGNLLLLSTEQDIPRTQLHSTLCVYYTGQLEGRAADASGTSNHQLP